MQAFEHIPEAARGLLVVASGAALLALLSLAPMPAGDQPTGYQVELQDCQSASAERSEGCYTEALLSLSRAETPVRALQALEELWDRGEVPRGPCHRIVHAIGHDAFRRLGWAAMAAEDGQVCGYGYKHSVIIGSLQDLRDPAAVAELCAGPPFAENRYRRWHCLHGVGHGLMVAHGYELFSALTDCDRMPDAADREICASGVFMENAVANELPPGKASPYWRPDEPFYACYRVAERHRPPCFRFQGASFAIHTADAGRPPAAACQGIAEPEHRRECYAGLGGAFAVISDFAVDKTLSSCLTVPSEVQGLCLETAAVVFIEQRQDLKDGARLCDQVPPRLGASCFSGVGGMVASLFSDADPQQRATRCREVAGAFADACIRRANGEAQ